MTWLLNKMGCGQSKAASKPSPSEERDQENNVHNTSKIPNNENNKVLSSPLRPLADNKQYATDTSIAPSPGEQQTCEKPRVQKRSSNNSLNEDANKKNEAVRSSQEKVNNTVENSPVKTPIKSAFKDRSSGPLQNKLAVSNSQVEFFQLLDAKIEEGLDYHSEEESVR